MADKKRNRSIIGLFLISMLFISLVSTAVLGYLWVSSAFSRFNEDSERLKQEYTDSQKEMIKNEIQRAVDYITFVRSSTDQRLRRVLKERVDVAYSIASHIYNTYKNKKSTAQAIQLIKDALRPIRFNNGRGYIYGYRMNGVLELYPAKPQNEGKNQFNIRDGRGIFVVQRELSVVKQKGEGFLTDSWQNPSDTGPRFLSKVSFVKEFKPLNGYLGSKEYREDFVKDIQAEILMRLGKIKFGSGGYIFVVDFDGHTLWNENRRDLIGQKVWATDSDNGDNIVRKAQETALLPEGGFIEYPWLKPGSAERVHKVSYVKAIKDWSWILGAGVYLDEIDSFIAERHLELKQNVKKQVLKATAFYLVVVAIVVLLTLFFSKRLRHEFRVFLAFFEKSTVGHEKIDKNELYADEFKLLADSANRMLEERLDMERSLRESEERLAVTFRAIAEGVITIDTQKRVALINRAAESLTGWSQNDAIGKPVEEVFHLISESGFHPPVNPVIEALEQDGVVQLNEPVVLESRGGPPRMTACSAAPIRDYAGTIIGAVLVFQDITERQKMEQELQKVHKLESLGILAGGIAHDFNNLLTGVLGNINLAKAYMDPGGKTYKTLIQAEKAVQKTKKLTQQLLTFASGGAPIKKVHALARLLEESVSFALRGSKIKYRLVLPDDLWPVEVDEGQVNQVFNNLCINAVQAMPDGGYLSVTAANVKSGADSGLPLPPIKFVKIIFQDSGPGIPEDIADKIFDPYFSTKPGGNGLGLTSAYSIVSKHDGCIDVFSKASKGAVFTVYLPASGKKPQVIEPEPETDGREKIIKGHGKILVMDDEKMVTDIASKMLSYLGYTPEVARDGQETLVLYKKAMDSQHPYDAVIMDLTIPGGMGGRETITRLRLLDPNVKAIVSSGYSNDPIMSNFLEYGFCGCIVKPYNLNELGTTLKTTLG